jgi:protein-tyrosine phosphatase
MVDIHCHILPGLDDGSDSLEISLKMAEMAIADGVTEVIATPHANGEYDFNPELIESRRDEIQSHLGDRLGILTGCDFHLNFENLQMLRSDAQRFTLNRGDYLLVELANFAIPASMDRTLHELKLAGLHPIITHPERNPLLRSQWDRLWGWMNQGCYVQVTAQSITGGFGRRAQQAAELLLEANAVHFVASDAHNVTTRPLRLKPAYDQLAKREGEQRARSLFEENPRAALENRPLPYVPESSDWKKAEIETEPESDRKRFWFF